MCGGWAPANTEKMPKVRSVKAVTKDGILALINSGFGFFLGLVDLQSTFTKAQRAETFYTFTKNGNPILQEVELTDDLATVLAAEHAVTKPRKNQVVILNG